MPEIGNLLVSLQMETASFNKGIADTNKKLDRFGNQFDRISKGITATAGTIGKAFAAVGLAVGAVAAIKGIAGWAKSMADAGETVGNLAIALGMSEASIVQLQGVFQLTTGSLEEASTAMKTFIGHIDDATGKAGPSRETFARLGITLADLKAKGDQPLEMLKLVADRMVQFKDDSFKAAVGAELFGKGWAKIAPLMKDGGAGIDEASKRAAELDPNARAAAAAGDELDKKMDELNKTITALSNDAFVLLKNAIFLTVDAIQAVVQTGRDIIAWAESISGPIVAAAQAIDRVMQTVIDGVRRVRAVASGSINPLTGDVKMPPLIDQGEIKEWKVVPLKPSIGPPGAGGGKKGGGKGGKDDTDKLARAAEQELKRRQREAIEAAEEESKISDERFRRQEQAIKNEVALDKKTKEEGIAAERDLLERKWLATQGFYARKLEAAKTDADETRKLRNQEKLDEERLITEREQLVADAAKVRHDKMKELWSDLGSSIKSSLESAFDSIIQGTFKLGTAIGNLLKDIGKKLASKAFDSLFDRLLGGSGGIGGIFGKLFGLGGGTAAALPANFGGPLGDFGHFATGGSFRVGGAGALDSQLVAFRASPGEMVDVHHGERGGGGSQLVRIELNPSEGWVAGVADQQIVTRSGQIIDVAVRQSTKTVQRNFAGYTAETQARQM